MREPMPPFTERYVFTGPSTAISCSVDWDRDQELYHAISDNGFHGLGGTAELAALNCFNAWVGLNHGWYQPIVDKIELWEIYFDTENYGLFLTEEEAEQSLKDQIAGHGPAWEDCHIRKIVVAKKD